MCLYLKIKFFSYYVLKKQYHLVLFPDCGHRTKDCDRRGATQPRPQPLFCVDAATLLQGCQLLGAGRTRRPGLAVLTYEHHVSPYNYLFTSRPIEYVKEAC